MSDDNICRPAPIQCIYLNVRFRWTADCLLHTESGRSNESNTSRLSVKSGRSTVVIYTM